MISMIESANVDFDIYDEPGDFTRQMETVIDASDHIIDIREYDVPYHVRVAIDKGRSTFSIDLVALE